MKSIKAEKESSMGKISNPKLFQKNRKELGVIKVKTERVSNAFIEDGISPFIKLNANPIMPKIGTRQNGCLYKALSPSRKSNHAKGRNDIKSIKLIQRKSKPLEPIKFADKNDSISELEENAFCVPQVLTPKHQVKNAEIGKEINSPYIKHRTKALLKNLPIFYENITSKGDDASDLEIEILDNELDKNTESKKIRVSGSTTDSSEHFIGIGTSSEKDVIGPQSFIATKLLGIGSFGEVYLVKKINTCQKYAMKVINKEKIISQNLVRYILTERRILSSINHPFIVRLHYSFQSTSKLFLILDYCPGGDLSDYLRREKKFTEERAKIYIMEILLALQHLHKKGIIFRDLKPDNVVIDDEGHALLTDFGLSKEGVFDNQGAKSFCGSFAYLAPEMIKKTGHGKSVDWYLLGVLLYEMIVGVPPYYSNDKEQLFRNIRNGVLKIPSTMSVPARELILEVRFNFTISY